MSPQAVDFNGDGHLDILAGTFDGSPHVAFGSAKGFAQPKHILDREGKRIRFSDYWDYKARKWVHENKEDQRHCTSAFAFDWDGDGDHDLLLGDYRGGRVFRQMNEGTNAKPLFTGKSILVEAGGKMIKLAGKLATLRLVDWNGDGRLDLLCGTIGKTYSQAGGGQLWLFLDRAVKGAPRFATGKCLLEATAPREGKATGPGAGFYFDATDYDGDGDLDLLVGGKATVLPVKKKLTAEEKAQAADLARQLQVNNKARGEIYKEARKAAGKRDTGWLDRYRKVMARLQPRMKPLMKEYRRLKAAQDKLVPRPKTKNLVWLYRNRG